MTKLLAIPLMVCAFVLSPMPASAERPTPVEFVENYTVDPLELQFREAGPNTFVFGTTLTDDWTGDLVGTSTQPFVIVNHAVAGFNFYSGLVEFEGSVLGRDGTLDMKEHGKQAGGTVLPGDAQWTGHWVIISGTGDLENLPGQGALSGPSFTLTFDGKVHFTCDATPPALRATTSGSSPDRNAVTRCLLLNFACEHFMAFDESRTERR